MLYYLYDGSFSGLLTSIYEAFHSDCDPDYIIKENKFKKSLFAKILNITTSEIKADKVAKAIKNKISKKIYKNIYYVYLSEKSNVELDIYYYLKKAFKEGKKINKSWADDHVRRIKKLSKKVGRERHKYLGLLRFRELEENILYAPFEPENFLLPIISNHFASRMKNKRWVIHDKRRELAVIYENNDWMLIDGSELPKINYSQDERYYQQLWKNFFDSITIKNRKNLDLQQNFMPKKYQKYLIEK